MWKMWKQNISARALLIDYLVYVAFNMAFGALVYFNVELMYISWVYQFWKVPLATMLLLGGITGRVWLYFLDYHTLQMNEIVLLNTAFGVYITACLVQLAKVVSSNNAVETLILSVVATLAVVAQTRYIKKAKPLCHLHGMLISGVKIQNLK